MGRGIGEAPSRGTAKHTWAASVEAAGTVSGTDDEGTDVPGTTTEVEEDAEEAILAGEAARLGLPFKPFQPSAERTDQ